ncbi:MAG: hypothetical protein ACLQJ0_20495 [Steroidobacteraceae bacterium]|jgi:hypothetical protein
MTDTVSCFLTPLGIDMSKTFLIIVLSSVVFLPRLCFSAEKSAADAYPEDCGKAPVFTCTVDHKTFRFVFRSVSNDCSNDDMQVTANDKVLNMPPAWYFESIDVSKNASPVCKYDPDPQNNGAYTAYPAGKHRVAMFNRFSARPGADKIRVSLFDASTMDVIDNLVIGSVGNQFLGIVKTKRGYRMPILVEAAENEFSCDCDAGTVSAWMEVTFDKNRIHRHWLKAPWKP